MNPKPMDIEQYESRIESNDGGDVVIQAAKGLMKIMTTGSDDRGLWVYLTPRQVMELKGAIANFENTAIRNGW